MNRPGTASIQGRRIVELTQRFPPALGGVERHVEHLARGLAGEGAVVHVVTTDLRRDRPFERDRFPSGSPPLSVRRHRAVRWTIAPHGIGIAAPGMLVDALGEDADVYHAHAFGYFPTWVGRWVRDVKRRPLVVTPHSDPGSGSVLSRAFHRATARATLARADRVIALTRSEADWLATLGVARDRVRVIPNGIDLEEFSGLRRLRPDAAPPTILFVGRIYPEQKGLVHLVEAFARLPERLGARLRLVGEDWGGAAQIRGIAERRGVASRLSVVGPLDRPALLREYGAADLFVLPSLFEPFGIVLLEAMASGLPIVATEVGGIPEVVDEGRTALLVRPADVDALSAAMRRVLEDASLALSLGREGRSRAERFAWPRLMPAYRELFAGLTEGGAR